MQDITERKLGELALRESDQRLRFAVRAANVGLWDWDLKTNKAHFSPEWKRQIGCDEHEISDDFSEWQRRVHPDDLEPTLDILRRYLVDPWPNYVVEFRLRHKDGSYRWILTQASLQYGDDVRPVRMLGSHVDITERKQVESALRESETHFRLLFEQATDGIFVADAQQRIIDANAQGCELMGYSREELLTLHIADILTPEEAVRIGPEMARLAGGEMVRSEWRGRRKDGSIFLAEVAAKQLPNGHLQRFVRDITQRKQAEQVLRENRERLQSLSRQLLTAQESERRKIARELHDEIGQILAGGSFSIESEPGRETTVRVSFPISDDVD